MNSAVWPRYSRIDRRIGVRPVERRVIGKDIESDDARRIRRPADDGRRRRGLEIEHDVGGDDARPPDAELIDEPS
jgi:hypothetical protein